MAYLLIFQTMQSNGKRYRKNNELLYNPASVFIEFSYNLFWPCSVALGPFRFPVQMTVSKRRGHFHSMIEIVAQRNGPTATEQGGSDFLRILGINNRSEPTSLKKEYTGTQEAILWVEK